MPRDTDAQFRPAELLVSFLAPLSFEADQYRALRQRVERLRRDAGCRVLAVTSAGTGEGKTVTTLNLAGSLAQAPGVRVLIVDADLHRPSVAEYLGLSERLAGLAEAIQDEKYGLVHALRRFESVNVSVLLAGESRARPYELLASPRFEAVMEDARRLFDYVLIDTPPLLPLADGRLLARSVDGLIVVVAAHKTPRKLLREALNLLDRAKVIGLVFNGDDRPLTAYYRYYGYTRSGQRPRPYSSWRGLNPWCS